eukprot:SAG11_NODE_312_length_10890_cov_44.733043_9_plen_78_part_00
MHWWRSAVILTGVALQQSPEVRTSCKYLIYTWTLVLTSYQVLDAQLMLAKSSRLGLCIHVYRTGTIRCKSVNFVRNL